jgi:hypothetical protein
MSVLEELAAQIAKLQVEEEEVSTPEYLITVNGKVVDEPIEDMKELAKVVKGLISTGAEIQVYKLEGEASVDLDIKIGE